jgi:hypothetical protein
MELNANNTKLLVHHMHKLVAQKFQQQSVIGIQLALLVFKFQHLQPIAQK